MHYTSKFHKKTGIHFSLLLSFSNLEKNPLIYLSEDEKIVACNNATLELYGVDNLESLILKTSRLIDSFVDEKPYYYSNSSGWCEDVCALGEQKVKINLPQTALKIYTLEMEHNRIDGYSYFIAVLRDTTILDRAAQAQRYFESFKEKFLHSISHEFRTPMNAIIGYSGLLENTPLDSQQNEYLDMIEKSTSSMMQNVTNLLQLMELESGLLKLNPKEYNPLKEYEQFADIFTDYADAKNIQLMLLIDPHLPKTLRGDYIKIKTVVSSLIDNALKFTPEGGNVYIEIKLRSHSDQNKSAEIDFIVSDTGPGISPERIITLLRPFASAWKNREQGINGLGIGLSLSHKLLELMNSKLKLNSELNKGSRFSFRIQNTIVQDGSFEFVEGSSCAIWAEDHRTAIQAKLLRNYLDLFHVRSIEIDGLATSTLKDVDILFIITDHMTKRRIVTLRNSFSKLKIVPIIHEKNQDSFDCDDFDAVMLMPILPHRLHRTLAVLWDKMPREYLNKRLKASNEKDFHNVKILVAEDNTINLKLLKTILLQESYQVVTAKNGQIAVDKYLKEHFDLVLMDIDMPVMDGVTANRLIKEINKHDKRPFTPVIALTAHALSGDKERIMKAGLDAHISKPIDKDRLIETIESFLELKRE
jgi:signal transduction histidine kinase/CheY-like chemotaxis protein